MSEDIHITNPDGSRGARVIFTKREPDELDRAFAEPIPDHIRSQEASEVKDALIRELVGSLQQWEDAMCAAICHPGVHIEIVSEVAQASRKGFDVLTLARTTCPEAFDGCNENSTS